jgi:hypothetical protein
MADGNKHNILDFESSSMRGLYECMESWQVTNEKRFLSMSVHQDDGKFCCVALTNPMEVVIVDGSDDRQARVFGYQSGRLGSFRH